MRALLDPRRPATRLAATFAVGVLAATSAAGGPTDLRLANDASTPDGAGAQRRRIESGVLEAEAIRVVRERFAGQVQRLEVRMARAHDMAVPAGRLEAQARDLPIQAPLSARMPVWLDIRVNGAWVRSLLVQLEVRAYQPGWVALRDLAAGTRIRPDDLRGAEVDVAASGRPAWNAEPQGQMLQSTALAGAYLTQAQVVASPAVARGDHVELRARSGAIEIVAPARALQDGQIGQRVQVRVDAAGGPILAKVVEPGVVEVQQ